ncbi:MAG: glycosyltransferase family 39 protein, partial [Ktedonobacteraceae bacterium]
MKKLDWSWGAPLALTCLGLILRLWTIRYTSPWPGDAQARVALSMYWLLHPHWIASGYWLPFPCYLNAFALTLWNDPVLCPRVIAAILGTLNLPIFYIYIKRLFGNFVAITSALLLSFMPLHVGLCASGLTDAWSITFYIAIFDQLMRCVDQTIPEGTRRLHFAAFFVAMVIEMTTRAESWGLIPFVVAYYFWRTRSKSASIGLLLGLLVIPVYWLTANYLDFHLPLVSFSGDGEPRIQPFSFVTALLTVNRVLLFQLGPIIYVGGWWGMFLLGRSLWKRRAVE